MNFNTLFGHISKIRLGNVIYSVYIAAKIPFMKKIAAIAAFILLPAISSFSQLPTYLPTYGLSAWFPFTGNANDSSGHGHNGTPYFTTNATGRYGVPNTAFYFNGTSSYIYVPPGITGGDNSTDITSSLTISAWVKSQNYLLSSQEQIYWRGDATPAHDPHMLYFNSGQVRIRRDIDPGSTVTEVGTPLSTLDTNFHMLTGTYDSITGVMKIYVDGMLRNSAVLPGLETYPTSTMYNYIGAVDGGTWQFFYGIIDELGLWKRALTPCEIAALYYSVPNIITNQPQNDTAISGTTSTFSIRDMVPGSTYQWQENSGSGFVNLAAVSPYAGVTTPTLTITPVTTAMSGWQYRCVPSSGSCTTDTTNAARLTVTLPSATRSTNSGQKLVVVPNPNRGIFTVAGTVGSNENIHIEVTDIVGKVIYSREIISLNGKIDNTIDLIGACTNGLYLLKLRGESIYQTLTVQVSN
jgi:hypothetical protein